MTPTSSRILQWFGLIIIAFLLGGGYWYWQVQAGSKLDALRTTTMTNGLIGYWSFDDGAGSSARDLSGNGKTGTLVNSPNWINGKTGKALAFNGSNQCVTTSLLTSKVNDVSFSFWANLKASSDTRGTMMFNGTLSGYGLVAGSSDGLNTGTFFFLSQTQYWLNTNIAISPYVNAWHHYVYTLSASGGSTVYRLYIDNTLVFTSSAQTNPLTPSGNSIIGAENTGCSNTIQHDMDEVRAYNRVLTEREVTNLYNLGMVRLNSSQTQGSSITNGLVGYWPLDEGTGTVASDKSGRANNGTLTNSPTWTNGKIGKAVNFDGTDDFINVPDSNSLDITQAISISAWVKGESWVNTENNFIVAKNDLVSGNEKRAYFFTVDTTGLLTFSFSDGASYGYANYNYALSTGVWYHVAVTYDRKFIRLYLNGANVANVAETDPLVANSNVLSIGRAERSSSTDYGEWHGQIDEVRLYERALSADELWLVYKTDAPSNVDTSLVGYWSFNGPDVSGTTAYDRSGSGNNGTLTNGPTVTPGLSGQAIRFDGSDDFISIGGSTSVKTLSYWVKANTTTNGGIELNANQYTNDNSIPVGWTSPIIYIDGIQQSTSYGSDIVSNGNFNSNISGWDTVAGASAVSWQNATSGDGSTGYHRFTIASNVDWDRFRGSGTVAASTTYRVQFWYRTSGITGNMNMFFTDNFDSMPNYVLSPNISPSTSWQRVSFIMTSTASAYPIFGFLKGGNVGTGTFDLDAVSIQPVTNHYLISDTNWHHVAITTDTTVTANAIKVGKGGFRYFSGILDEVRIYNRALSTGEIESLYRLGQSDKVNSSASQNQGTGRLDSGLVGYWPMDDGSGTTATDTSTNGNNGSLTNGPTWTTGQIGGAVNFDGVNDYVLIGNVGTIQNISYWINRSSAGYAASLWGSRLSVLDNGLVSGTTSSTRYINGALAASELLGSELLTNGTLESGNISPWVVNYSGGGNGSVSVTSSSPYAGSYALNLNVTAAGSQSWHIQTYQVSFSLTSGQLYKLQFAAKGSTAKSGLLVNPIINVDPWPNAGNGYTFDITTSWVVHTVYFYATSTTSSGGLFFDAGNNGTYNLYLDNISLKPVNAIETIGNGSWNFISVNFDSPISASSASLAFSHARYLSGSLDDVRMYNRALSPDEVSLLYKTTAPTNPDTGLKGYWSFNGQDMSGTTAYDRSGSGNNGTLTNGPTVTPGKIGQGLNFDGSDDYINLGTSTLGVSSGSSGLTLSAWVKANAFTSYSVIIGKTTGVSPYGGWQLNTNADSGNKFDFAVNVSGTWRTVIADGSGSSTFSTGTWYHVVGTYDGTTLRKYVNGVPDGTATVSGTIQYQSTSADVYIGKNPGTGAQFQGVIDEVRIYNRALSATEVAALYNQGR